MAEVKYVRFLKLKCSALIRVPADVKRSSIPQEQNDSLECQLASRSPFFGCLKGQKHFGMRRNLNYRQKTWTLCRISRTLSLVGECESSGPARNTTKMSEFFARTTAIRVWSSINETGSTSISSVTSLTPGWVDTKAKAESLSTSVRARPPRVTIPASTRRRCATPHALLSPNLNVMNTFDLFLPRRLSHSSINC